MGERLSGGSEAPRIASSWHTPNQLIPLHVSLTPLVSCPKVGTFGCQDHWKKRYSTSDSGSHLQCLINCDPRGRVATELRSLWFRVRDERSHNLQLTVLYMSLKLPHFAHHNVVRSLTSRVQLCCIQYRMCGYGLISRANYKLVSHV